MCGVVMRRAAVSPTAWVFEGLPSGAAVARNRRAQNISIDAYAEEDSALQAMKSAQACIVPLAAGPAADPIITILPLHHLGTIRLRPVSISPSMNSMCNRADSIRITTGKGCLSALPRRPGFSGFDP
jgi:hypothetical protein